ncbi:uncharacterized, partial [Tachysurus ichikawai]
EVWKQEVRWRTQKELSEEKSRVDNKPENIIHPFIPLHAALSPDSGGSFSSSGASLFRGETKPAMFMERCPNLILVQSTESVRLDSDVCLALYTHPSDSDVCLTLFTHLSDSDVCLALYTHPSDSDVCLAPYTHPSDSDVCLAPYTHPSDSDVCLALYTHPSDSDI